MVGGVLMSGIAVVGSVTLVLKPATLDRLLLPLVTYALSTQVNISWLIPFAAGNFIYIGASDLVPEVNKHREGGGNVIHLLAFGAGLLVLLVARLLL